MPWQYRVVHQVCDGEDVYAIHEAHFDHDKVEAVHSVTAEPVCVSAESPSGLVRVLGWMVTACAKPVLEMADIEAQEADDEG